MHVKYFNIPLYVQPNRWDAIAFILIFAVLAMLGEGAHQMHAPIMVLQEAPISLDPSNLPHYALRTVLRMFAAIGLSLLFTFIYATLAAKSRRAETIMIPILDILQSVPVLGFISFTVAFFMRLFPGNILGAECAAIFAIFTSQAWNMTFSFYQSLRTVPRDLEEVSRSLRLSSWQRFWKLDVPFAAPGLVWNMMISMSGGWFFVVASEAITVGDTTFTLPGIGSYMAVAITQKDTSAIFYAILTMFLVILAYDQLLFRPLVVWSDKFRFSSGIDNRIAMRSWVLRLFSRTRALRMLLMPVGYLWQRAVEISLPKMHVSMPLPGRRLTLAVDIAWWLLVAVTLAWGGWRISHYITSTLVLSDIYEALGLGMLTMLRVIILIALASLLWIPIGVWIGLRPRVAAAIQPLAQFLAAFPANLFFPVAVIAIVRWDLMPDIWLSPLMILGTQWFILFNVIAGAMTFPRELQLAATNFHIRGWQWWRKVMLPGILPYYVTGAVAASGGAWNASIVAEFIHWGDTTLKAKGLGSYIAQATTAGDYPRIVLGVAVMALYVILYNRLLWHRLYRYAEQRLRLS